MTTLTADTTRTWSPQQEAIFAAFAQPDGNLIVRARAGTGKTTTILEGIERAPERSIILCAFNKRIQEELQQRLRNPYAQAKTLHAMGYQAVRLFWERIRVCSRNERAIALSEAVCGAQAPDAIKKLVTKLHTKGREIAPLALKLGDLSDLAEQFDCIPDEEWAGYGIDEKWVEARALEAMQLAATKKPFETGIDYADMIYLPVRNRWLRPMFDLVVVDEAQDMTAAQLDLARGLCSGRFVLVGDDRQCQPAGTLVRVSKYENVPIESLVPGDKVVAFDRHGQAFVGSGVVTETAARHYRGQLYTISAGGRVSRSTDSHKWLVRWANRSADVWVTYLMRKGRRYRVGQCRLFRVVPSGTGGLATGVGQRCRVERADAAWILKVHESVEDALAYEQIIATRYGLPEMCFHPASNIKYFTQAVIDRVYKELGDLKENAIRCLEEHGRSLDFPFYVRNDVGRMGRQTLFVTQACNLIPHYMALPIAPAHINGYDKPDRHAVEWQPLDVHSEQFDGEVYSLNVAKYHKYVADGIVTCNSIYAFRGADATSLDRLKVELNARELGLTVTYRCGRTIVAEAQRLVTDFEAAPTNGEGLITSLPIEQLAEDVSLGDFVLSRKNAPLASIAMSLIRKQKRVKVAGRDIGAGLKAIVEKLAKGRGADSIPALLDKLVRWEARECERALRAGRENQIEQVLDKAETLRVLIDGVTGVSELFARIDGLFTDDGLGSAGVVTCSSVHKAKGLEADKVYVLRDSLGGFTKKDGDTKPNREEENIEYVAITRARHHLVWVEGLPA